MTKTTATGQPLDQAFINRALGYIAWNRHLAEIHQNSKWASDRRKAGSYTRKANDRQRRLDADLGRN